MARILLVHGGVARPLVLGHFAERLTGPGHECTPPGCAATTSRAGGFGTASATTWPTCAGRGRARHPILVGHSMGGLPVQKSLEDGDAAGGGADGAGAARASSRTTARIGCAIRSRPARPPAPSPAPAPGHAGARARPVLHPRHADAASSSAAASGSRTSRTWPTSTCSCSCAPGRARAARRCSSLGAERDAILHPRPGAADRPRVRHRGRDLRGPRPRPDARHGWERVADRIDAWVRETPSLGTTDRWA